MSKLLMYRLGTILVRIAAPSPSPSRCRRRRRIEYFNGKHLYT